ncbi:arginyltransferase [Rheinheimera riviphila]|uniref:Aspartate/glutamate leucyltransferase n=2 Tax=Rheinheimera riviphila TaxID=1834037 RepID=A0A437R3Q2_9GAMM|nr:arginyltransferase [Rheinheimera riviphila]
MDLRQIQLGLTGEHHCSYLAEQSERLVFTLPDQPLSPAVYQQLMNYNFRRTGQQLYRPYCSSCQACQAVRIAAEHFVISTSQRKLLHKAKKAQWHYRVIPAGDGMQYIDLYQQYIRGKHAGGVMDPPDPEHLYSMFHCDWLDILVLEQYQQEQLVGVMILDQLPDGLSAVYSFYQPDSNLALGKLAILAALEYLRAKPLAQLYLGYYILECQKMSYKADFGPQQRLIAGNWQSFD